MMEYSRPVHDSRGDERSADEEDHGTNDDGGEAPLQDAGRDESKTDGVDTSERAGTKKSAELIGARELGAVRCPLAGSVVVALVEVLERDVAEGESSADDRNETSSNPVACLEDAATLNLDNSSDTRVDETSRDEVLSNLVTHVGTSGAREEKGRNDNSTNHGESAAGSASPKCVTGDHDLLLQSKNEHQDDGKVVVDAVEGKVASLADEGDVRDQERRVVLEGSQHV